MKHERKLLGIGIVITVLLLILSIYFDMNPISGGRNPAFIFEMIVLIGFFFIIFRTRNIKFMSALVLVLFALVIGDIWLNMYFNNVAILPDYIMFNLQLLFVLPILAGILGYTRVIYK